MKRRPKPEILDLDSFGRKVIIQKDACWRFLSEIGFLPSEIFSPKVADINLIFRLRISRLSQQRIVTIPIDLTQS